MIAWREASDNKAMPADGRFAAAADRQDVGWILKPPAMNPAEHVRATALAIDTEIRALPLPNVPSVRAVRCRFSRRLRDATGDSVLALARELHHVLGHRWVALELLLHHEPALSLISASHLDEFAQGLDGWGSVDSFAVLLAGPAWLRRQVPDSLFHQWAASEDRWRRRAALASTVVLNTPSRGGKGDVARTLAICELLVNDRDDMVIKALSWALRKLVPLDRRAVQRFLADNDTRLAARVKREVRNKLTTGLKNPRSAPPRSSA